MFSIKSWLEFSLVDWPGKVAMVVFLPGCNFRCPFCHNHRLVESPETLEDIPPEAVLRACRDKAGWIDGIVVSGGEPTIHPWLPELLQAFKACGLAVKLDSNGSRPHVLADLIRRRLVDHIAMDIKAPLEEALYSRLAGVPVDIEDIRRSAEIIAGSGLPHTFRTTVVPELMGEAEVAAIARSLPGAGGLALQNFSPETTLDPAWRKKRGFSEEEIYRLDALVRDILLPVPVQQRVAVA